MVDKSGWFDNAAFYEALDAARQARQVDLETGGCRVRP